MFLFVFLFDMQQWNNDDNWMLLISWWVIQFRYVQDMYTLKWYFYQVRCRQIMTCWIWELLTVCLLQLSAKFSSTPVEFVKPHFFSSCCLLLIDHWTEEIRSYLKNSFSLRKFTWVDETCLQNLTCKMGRSLNYMVMTTLTKQKISAFQVNL